MWATRYYARLTASEANGGQVTEAGPFASVIEATTQAKCLGWVSAFEIVKRFERADPNTGRVPSDLGLPG